MINNADPDQLASSEALLQKPTDLDLHCLLRQGMLCSVREWLSLLVIRRSLHFDKIHKNYNSFLLFKLCHQHVINVAKTCQSFETAIMKTPIQIN